MRAAAAIASSAGTWLGKNSRSVSAHAKFIRLATIPSATAHTRWRCMIRRYGAGANQTVRRKSTPTSSTTMSATVAGNCRAPGQSSARVPAQVRQLGSGSGGTVANQTPSIAARAMTATTIRYSHHANGSPRSRMTRARKVRISTCAARVSIRCHRKPTSAGRAGWA